MNNRSRRPSTALPHGTFTIAQGGAWDRFRADETNYTVQIDSVATHQSGSSANDARDMLRMGKRQELERNYRAFSAFSFTVVLTATWEFILVSNEQGLIDGGLGGLFWTFIWTFWGFGTVILSLAEMASMAPTSGGQYHWVSEFAPGNCQKFLSYMSGWFSTLSWQAGAASGSLLTSTMVLGLVTVLDPSFVPSDWQVTLVVFPFVTVLFVLNVWGAKTWPMMQNVLLIIHFFAFMVVIIIFWILAPTNDAGTVFLSFSNRGGWGTLGLALQIGQTSAIYAANGSDAAVHVAEETRDASRVVPLAMIWAYLVNGIIASILLVSYLFVLTNMQEALADPSQYPFIWVFKQALQPSGVAGLTAMIILLLFGSNVSYNASTARQTFAFARDSGLPFSKWIAHISSRKRLPCNAILLSCGLTCILSLINAASSTAFAACVSLQVSALMFTYCISIACILIRRIRHPETMPIARWSLGKMGVPVNTVSLLYSLYVFFWSFWPTTTAAKTSEANSFNWAAVLFGLCLVLSLIVYQLQGRHKYQPPVNQVQYRLSL